MKDVLFSQVIPRTLQGEGKFVGEPSIFFRTAVCNLTCSWCDTKYSWEQKSKDKWHPKTLEDLRKFYPQNPSDWGMVITGGEPLLWANHTTFINLLWDGTRRFKRVTIETNGTRWAEGLNQESLRYCWISCSPKLSNGGDPFEKRHVEHILRTIDARENSYFKFVIGTKKDVAELISQFGFLSKEKIYLMPQGATPQELRETIPLVTDLCMKHGFMMSPRLHIDMGLE